MGVCRPASRPGLRDVNLLGLPRGAGVGGGLGFKRLWYDSYACRTERDGAVKSQRASQLVAVRLAAGDLGGVWRVWVVRGGLEGWGKWRQGWPFHHEGPAPGSGGPRLGHARQEGEITTIVSPETCILRSVLRSFHTRVDGGGFAKRESGHVSCHPPPAPLPPTCGERELFWKQPEALWSLGWRAGWVAVLRRPL